MLPTMEQIQSVNIRVEHFAIFETLVFSLTSKYIEIGLFKIKSPRALEIGMVQTSVISLALEIEIVRNAVKLEKLYSN